MKETRTMAEITAEVYADLAKYESDIELHNDNLIRSFGRNAKDNFSDLLDFAEVTGKIEFVDTPSGTSCNEKYGVFKEVWCQQWNQGMEGDSFSGFLFARLKDNRWIKIPYSC